MTKKTLDLPTKTPEDIKSNELAAVSSDKAVMSYSPALVRAGRLQVHHASQALHRVALVKEFEIAKINRDYIGLPYSDQDGNVRRVADIKDYCQVFLDKSYRTVAEDHKNYSLLGEDRFSKAQEMKLLTAHYRDIRKLPDDELSIIKEAIDSQNRDGIISLLDDFKAELETTKSKVDTLEKDAKSNEDILADKNKKIDEYDKKLKEKEINAQEWKSVVFNIQMEITEAAATSAESIDKLEQLRTTITTKDFKEEHSELAYTEMATVYYHGCQRLTNITAQLMLDCQALFGQYEDAARPMIESLVSDEDGNNNE